MLSTGYNSSINLSNFLYMWSLFYKYWYCLSHNVAHKIKWRCQFSIFFPTKVQTFAPIVFRNDHASESSFSTSVVWSASSEPQFLCFDSQSTAVLQPEGVLRLIHHVQVQDQINHSLRQLQWPPNCFTSSTHSFLLFILYIG